MNRSPIYFLIVILLSTACDLDSGYYAEPTPHSLSGDYHKSVYEYDDKIGVLLYTNANASGKPTILNKDDACHLFDFTHHLETMVVAEGCGISVMNDSSVGSLFGPGVHHDVKLTYDRISVQCETENPAFEYAPTSHAYVDQSRQGAYLIGRFDPDLQSITTELGYPVITQNQFDCNFPLPSGQGVNVLNGSMGMFDYWQARGGFFKKVNIPWVVSAVDKGEDIYVVSTPAGNIYRSNGRLTAFGKEVYYLEERYGLRYDPVNDKMRKVHSWPSLKRQTKTNDADYSAEMSYSCSTAP